MDGLLITAENVDRFCGPEGAEEFDFGGHTRILNANKNKLGSSGLMFAKPLSEAFEIIPEEQWPDLIADKDRKHNWLDDIIGDLPCKDQDGLGYCHGYGPVTALEVMRALSGLPYVELSAESVAGRVTGWQNEGGDPEEDLQVLKEYGACAAAYMDRANSIRPKQWQAGWESNALLHRSVEVFAGLDGDLWTMAGTAALRNQCTSPWYNWWSHCISGSYRLRYNPKTRQVERKDRNNWGMDWGEKGYCWFSKGQQRSGGTPSGLVIVRAPTPSET
jgi:hypothetical protein